MPVVQHGPTGDQFLQQHRRGTVVEQDRLHQQLLLPVVCAQALRQPLAHPVVGKEGSGPAHRLCCLQPLQAATVGPDEVGEVRIIL